MSLTTDPSGAYFVSVVEFGRRCALGRSTAYELVRTGVVRTVREGNRILVPIAEVERYVAAKHHAAGIEPAHTTTPGGEPGAVVEIFPGAGREGVVA